MDNLPKTITVQIPFSGFYESIHSVRIDQAIESHYNYDYDTGMDIEIPVETYDAIFMANVDHKAIDTEYCQEYVDAFNNELDMNFKFLELTSPKEYNFSTDKIYTTVNRNEFNTKIRSVVESLPEWTQSVKDNYTSYDGFHSFYSNNINDDIWTRPVLDECQYNTMLQCYIETQLPEDALFYLCDDFEISNWTSVDNAITVIDKYIKDKGIK